MANKILHNGWLQCLFIVLTCLTAASCRHSTDVRAIKLAHTLDISHPVHKAIVHLGETLAQVSHGQMRLDIYPNGQLGSERELIELLQIGSLGMTKVSASPLEGFVPEMEIFSIPYIYRDHEHFWQVLGSDIGRRLLLAPEKVRLRGLGYYDSGSRSFYTTNKPVYSPADLKGMKIRVMKSQTAVKTVQFLGGAATPIAWGELYTALQQGIVDGSENNPPTFWISRHYEVAKYYTLDEHTSIPDILLVGQHVWQSLTEQQQQWLQQAVDASVAFQRELWSHATEAALVSLKEHQVRIIRPDKSQFQQRVEAMHDSYKGTETGKLLVAIKAMGLPVESEKTLEENEEVLGAMQ